MRRYGHLRFFQHGGGRHLGFVRTVNSAVRSAVPENPTLEPNMKWIGSPVAEIWPFAYVGAYGTPILGGRGGRMGQRQTDRQTTCDRNTALCTKVHRAVKTVTPPAEIWPYTIMRHRSIYTITTIRFITFTVSYIHTVT